MRSAEEAATVALRRVSVSAVAVTVARHGPHIGRPPLRPPRPSRQIPPAATQLAEVEESRAPALYTVARGR